MSALGQRLSDCRQHQAQHNAHETEHVSTMHSARAAVRLVLEHLTARRTFRKNGFVEPITVIALGRLTLPFWRRTSVCVVIHKTMESA